MKSMKTFLNAALVSFLFAGTLAQAAQLTGTVTNKTTGKPAAGDAVVLVEPMTGMTEVAHTTVDNSGHYTITRPTNAPALVKVTHQGAEFFADAPQTGAIPDIAVYDVAPKVDGVFIEADVLELEVANGQLHVIERYFVHNTSMPPRTQWSPKSFEIVLPEEAIVESAQGQRPSTGSLPTTLKLQPNGAKGHYAFNFPIQPDEGDKDTQFNISYTIPYSGSFTFRPQVSLPTQSVGVLLPKSMTFAAGSGSVFSAINQDPNIQTFVAKNAAPGKALEFTVSGTGSMPREDQGAGGPQSGCACRWTARRRNWRTHQYTRSAQQIQVVDSWRAGSGVRCGCGIPAAQAHCSGGGADSAGSEPERGITRLFRLDGSFLSIEKRRSVECVEGRTVHPGERKADRRSHSG